MKRVQGTIPAVWILAGFALLVIPGMATAQKRVATVKVDTVVQQPLSQTMPVIGRFVASQTGVVAALARGPVDTVRVAIGDKIGRAHV